MAHRAIGPRRSIPAFSRRYVYEVVVVERSHHSHHPAGNDLLVDVVGCTVSVNMTERTLHAERHRYVPHNHSQVNALRQNLEVLGSILRHRGNPTYCDENQ
jgi:hypothetical protein